MSLRWSSAILVVSALLGSVGSASEFQRTKRPTKPSRVEQPSAEAPQAEPVLEPGEVARIAVEDLKEMIARKKPVTIIDARSPLSWDSATTKIKGAIRMVADEGLPPDVKNLPRDREIVTYCT